MWYLLKRGRLTCFFNHIQKTDPTITTLKLKHLNILDFQFVYSIIQFFLGGENRLLSQIPYPFWLLLTQVKLVNIELGIDNDLDLRENSYINSLPTNLKVEGNLILRGYLGITFYPENLEVGGD